MADDDATEVLQHGTVSRVRWRSVKADARHAVRQLLLREAEAAERDLVHARKRADAIEVARLSELAEGCRAALAVIDDATVVPG